MSGNRRKQNQRRNKLRARAQAHTKPKAEKGKRKNPVYGSWVPKFLEQNMAALLDTMAFHLLQTVLGPGTMGRAVAKVLEKHQSTSEKETVN